MAISERLAIVVEANAGKAIAEFKQLGAATKGLGGPVGEVKGLMGGLTSQFGGLAKATTLVAAGAALLKFAATGIDAFTTLAEEVKSFRRIAGGTAEDSSRLVAAFKAMGIDAQTAAGGVFMLEKRIASGQANLEKFGVTVARDRKGNTDMAATLLNIADAYSRTTDPAARAAIGAAAFGRQAVTLVPLLARGKEGIKDLYAEAERHGLILSDADIIRADELKIAMRNLKESVQGLQVSAGRTLVPAVTNVVGLIDKLLQRIEEVQKGPAKDAAGGPWDFFTKGMSDVNKFIDDLTSHLPTLAKEVDPTKKSLEELGQETTDVGNAIKGAVDADRSLASAKRDLVADQRSLADDTREYNDLLAKTAVDAEKVADAQRALAEATRSVGHAQREQADAQREFDKASAAAAILGTDTALEKKQDAADKLADANDSVASALGRQTDAARELAKQRAGDPDYQYKLAAAKQKVADDTQSIADAEQKVGEKALAAANAHDAEATALASKADAVERLLADYDAMIAKTPEAAGALLPLITAAQASLGAPKPGSASPVLATGAQAGGGLLGSSLGQLTTVPAVTPPLQSGLLTAGTPTTNNNTFNITAPATIDPLNLANAILWNLN